MYLDHNATAPLLPEARQAALDALDAGLGHPSARHRPGRRARDVVEAARAAVAALAGRPPSHVTLTSGATEANVTAVHHLRATGARRLVIGATEHPSLRAVAPEAIVAPVGPDGRHDLDALDRLLRDADALLLLAAEPETGTTSDLPAIAALVARHGVAWHCDAAQWAGRLPLDLPADSLTVSGHKLGAPTGCGALVHRGDLRPLLPGHRTDRAGTPALFSLAGLAAAVPVVQRQLSDGTWAAVAARRDALEAGLRARPGAVVHGAHRLPNTVCVTLTDDGLALVEALALRGVAIGTGSACATGAGPSPTLRAMGVPAALAAGAVRFSLGPTTTDDDVRGALAAVRAALG